MNPITPVNSNVIYYADFVRLTTRQRYDAGWFATGEDYTILSIGTTDFTTCGTNFRDANGNLVEPSNTVGLTFTATDYGSGTGIATQPQYYNFSTAPNSMIFNIDGNEITFNGLGSLVQIGNATRDIKSTANETTFTLGGIDSANLSLVLGTDIKGSKIEAWHGFFNSDNTIIISGGGNGLYKFFTGYINSFAITEQWNEEVRGYIAAIAVSASSIQMILRNRVAGRYTNDASWQFFNANDISMKRVAALSTLTFAFGKNK